MPNRYEPPPLDPIRPIRLSRRWFPSDRGFGLYAHQGRVAPNVTSILGHFYPFDAKRWAEVEPDIDHEAVAREAAERGTAVHKAMEYWLAGRDHQYDPELEPWVEPLQRLISGTRKRVTIRAVEVPLWLAIEGVGMYAGSSDVLAVAQGEVILMDFKTKRPGKNVTGQYEGKNKTQLAAYSIAVNALYADQLGGPVARASLLYAHPDRDEPTVIRVEGDELAQFQDHWRQILGEWFEQNGDAVAEEQARFDAARAAKGAAEVAA